MSVTERRVELAGKILSYEHRVSARAKHLRLAVHRGGLLVATSPAVIPHTMVESFILRKSRWVVDSIERQSKFSPHIKTTRSDFIKHKESARRLVLEKIRKLNERFGFEIGRVSIRDQKTRWGSCSSEGNLNFNYKIALLPDRLAEYIVAHELCHLKEMNHSPRFWALVEKMVPDYRVIQEELERSGIRPN